MDSNIAGAGSGHPGNGSTGLDLDRSDSDRCEDRLSDPDRTETDSNHSVGHRMSSVVDDQFDSFARSSPVQQQDPGSADEIPNINDAAADSSRSENRALGPNTRAVSPGHTDSTISETELIAHGPGNLMNPTQGSPIVKAEHDVAEGSKDLPADSKTTGNTMDRINASPTVKAEHNDAEDPKEFPIESKTTGTDTAPGRQQTKYRLRNLTKTEISATSINRDSTSGSLGHPSRDLPASGSGSLGLPSRDLPASGSGSLGHPGRDLTASGSGRSGHGPVFLQNPSASSQRPSQVLPASNNYQLSILQRPVVQNSITDSPHAEHPDAVLTSAPVHRSLEDLVSELFDKKLAEAQARIAAEVVRTIMAPNDRNDSGSEEEMAHPDLCISKTPTGRIVWDHKADIHLMLALFYEMNPNEENWSNILAMLRTYGFDNCTMLAFKQHLVRIGKKFQPDNRYRGDRVLPDRNERPAPLFPPRQQSQPAHDDQPARGKKRAATTRDTDRPVEYGVDQTPDATWDQDVPSEDEFAGPNKRFKSEEDGLAPGHRPGNPVPRPVEYYDEDGFPRALYPAEYQGVRAIARGDEGARREVLGSTGTHVGYAHDVYGPAAHHEYRARELAPPHELVFHQPAGGMGHQGNPGPGSFWDLNQDLPAPAAPARLPVYGEHRPRAPVYGEHRPRAPVYGGGGQRPYEYGHGHYYRGLHGGAYQPPMNQYHRPMVQHQHRAEFGQPQPYQPYQQQQQQSGSYGGDEEDEERRQRNH